MTKQTVDSPVRADAAGAACRTYLSFAPSEVAKDAADVGIFGVIGDTLFGDGVSARDLVASINGSKASELVVRINSPGGVVSDGFEIFNALKRHPARKRVYVDGQAASIAALIAMAGDEVVMGPASLFMIHAPHGVAIGNAPEVRRFAESLDAHARAMAEGLSARVGKREQILDLVSDGVDHWYTASEAVAFGFADRVWDAASDKRAHAKSAEVAGLEGLLASLESAPDNIVTPLRAAVARALSPSVFSSLASPHKLAAFHLIEDPEMKQNYQTILAGPAGTLSTPPATVDAAVREEVLSQERHRIHTIREMGAPHIAGRPQVSGLIDRAIADGWTTENFGQQVLAALAQGVGPLGGFAGVVAGSLDGRTPVREFTEAASDVLAMRGGVAIPKPHAGARDIQAMSIADMARRCLPHGAGEFEHTAAGIIQAALTTSDFPYLLENTLRKSLRNGYENEPGTHSSWMRRTTVPDFKPHSRAILGAMPELDQVLEGAEYKYGSPDEDRSVPFAVEKWGVIVPVTFEALVNDDLNALARIPQGLGQAARRAEADKAYALFDGNGPDMQDGKPLFHVDHGNLLGSASGLTKDALAAARMALRKQLTVGGGALNLGPRFLLVPPELESDAEALIAASSIHVTERVESGTPAWISSLQLVVEARLPPTAFYLVASNGLIDTAEIAFLDSENGAVVFEHEQYKRDVIDYKVRDVFGVRALDWRGFTKTPIA